VGLVDSTNLIQNVLNGLIQSPKGSPTTATSINTNTSSNGGAATQPKGIDVGAINYGKLMAYASQPPPSKLK
jgi:hypothetical protein